MMEVIYHFLVNEDEAHPEQTDIKKILKRPFPYSMAVFMWEELRAMGSGLFSGMLMESDLPIIIIMKK